MAAVAVAADGASFEDVTGELDVRRVRVRTVQETPDPVPYGVVADLTWRMPSVLPRRRVPVLAVAAGASGVVVAVLLVVAAFVVGGV